MTKRFILAPIIVALTLLLTCCNAVQPEPEPVTEPPVVEEPVAEDVEQPAAEDVKEAEEVEGDEATSDPGAAYAAYLADFDPADVCSPQLTQKLNAGLADTDPLQSYAWQQVRKSIADQARSNQELSFIDAEIALELTDSFNELYPDRNIECYMFTARIQTEPQLQPDRTGGALLDADGWLTNDIGQGRRCLIVEEAAGQRSVVAGCFPEAEGRSLATQVTTQLIYRDLENGEDVTALLLQDLAASLSFTAESGATGAFFFQLSPFCPDPQALTLKVSAQLNGEQVELSEQIEIVSDEAGGGIVYRLPYPGAEYQDLSLQAQMPDNSGSLQEISVELIVDPQ